MFLEESTMKKIIAGMMMVACAAGLIGCETMKGAGRDMQDAGHNVQKAAS